MMVLEIRRRIDDLVWGNTFTKHGFWGAVLANFLRYLYALLRDMFAGQLMLRSMSLVYTTLLSIVPFIAFSFSVLKGFDMHTNTLQPFLFTLAEPLGPQGAELVRQLIVVVDNVKGGVLGGVSLAFFIYTAVSMVQKVEESFNFVWHVARPRNLGRRIVEYLVVMLIGPVVVVIALGMIASLRSNTVVQLFLNAELVGPIFVATSKLTPYLLITAVFTFIYIYIPNTRVKFRSALVGGVAGGTMWATISVLFATFVVVSTRTQLIYSGFAVAILALIWLYLNWLILLIGAQLAFYHQNPAFLRIGRREPRLSNAMRERLALNIMLLVGKAFRQPERHVTIASLAKTLRVPSVTLTPVSSALEEGGLLMSTEDEALLPGREVSRIPLSEILAVVREKGETGSYRNPQWTTAIDALGKRLDTAVANEVGDQSLADLLDEAEKLGRKRGD